MVELQDIFNIEYGNKLDLNKMSHSKSNIDFVGRSGKNNGITAKVDKLENIEPYDAGLLTVALGGSVLSTFLQQNKFYTAQNIAVLKPIEKMSTRQKLFYCYAIKSNAFRFSTCGREANRTLRNLSVPALDEIPNWVNDVNLTPFVGAEFAKLDIDVELPAHTKTKTLKEIFDIKNGIASTKLKEFDNPSYTRVAYIRPASTQTRTLRSFIEKDSVAKEQIHPKGTLFVSTNGEGSHSYSYVSNCYFVGNSDVSILIPKQKNMPFEVKLFYTRCISANRYKFSYGRKPKGERLESIKLPYFETKEEFDYIVKFIQSLPFSSSIYRK